MKNVLAVLSIPILLSCIFSFSCQAGQFESRNGKDLPVSGTIRILVLLAEVHFTTDRAKDPTGLKGEPQWRAGTWPSWANNDNPELNAFDFSDTLSEAQGLFSKYFYQASFGQFRVIADFLKCPENGGIFRVESDDGVVRPQDALNAANTCLGNSFHTLKGHDDFSYFDNWIMSKPGLPKLHRNDSTFESPGKWDHVMIIWRNNLGKQYNPSTKEYFYNSINGNGYCSPGSPGMLLGYHANTYSNFSIYGQLNVNIMRHEFSHLLLGGNNFHVAGGGNGEPNYWIPKISAYSMLALYDATLACWNGWDRQRLGWQLPGNKFEISARTPDNNTEVNADLSADSSGLDGLYLLRDFVTSGDAIRIRLPANDPLNSYPQFLWIENHNGMKRNKCPFDRWMYADNPCIDTSVYGIYIYMQIDKDIRSSDNSNEVFGGFADYLRMVSADGFYDRELDTFELPEKCLGNIPVRPFRRLPDKENPLTGSGDNDQIVVDLDKNHRISAGDMHPNDIENFGNGMYDHSFVQNGNNRQVYTLSGKRKIGLMTNPSTASMGNLVSFDGPVGNAKNQNKIFLNGISIEIVEQNENGNILLKIRFDDTEVTGNVRWCGSELILNNNTHASSFDLDLKKKSSISLERGITPTRMDKPVDIAGSDVFTDKTRMIFRKSRIRIDTSACIAVNDSSILNLDQAEVTISKDGFICVNPGCALKLSAGSKVRLYDGARIRMEAGSTLEIEEGVEIIFEGKRSRLEINGEFIADESVILPNNSSGKRIRNIKLGRNYKKVIRR